MLLLLIAGLALSWAGVANADPSLEPRARQVLFDENLSILMGMIDKNPSWTKQAYPHGTPTPGYSLLHLAAKQDQPDTVKYLLSKGAIPNALFPLEDQVTPGSVSPFHVAALRNNVGIVEIFLDAGLAVDDLGEPFDRSGKAIVSDSSKTLVSKYTALEWATHHGAEAVVVLLLHRGAKIRDNSSDQKDNAIHLAMYPSETYDRDAQKRQLHAQNPIRYPFDGIVPSPGYRQMIDALLEAGADLRQPNYAGDQPLHIAAEHFSCDTIEYLLSQHVGDFDIDARNKKGMTPLMVAVCAFNSSPKLLKQQGKVIQLLIASGADRSLTCRYEGQQMTAYDIAKRRGLDGTICKLLQYSTEKKAQ